MKLRIPGKQTNNADQSLPTALQDEHSRSSHRLAPEIQSIIEIKASYELQAPKRAGTSDVERSDIDDNDLLALETHDGTTLFISVKKLREDLQRKYPDQAGDEINLRLLEDPNAQQRGMGAWVWSKLSIFKLKPDSLIDTAKREAFKLLKEKLKLDALEMAEAGASWIGTKMLMAAIESKLAGEPGLYRWKNDTLTESDRVLYHDKTLANDAKQGLMLLFIHGTASSTTGSFKYFKQGMTQYGNDKISEHFGDRLYGYEHRTFSDSPIDNALEIANALPANSQLCLVTHSRGGLVGDLLCINQISEKEIQRYTRKAPTSNGESKETEEQKRIREWVNQEEQRKLRQLSDLLRQKQFIIKRYVRVACPAAGTQLLSDNLDLFLSTSLSLMKMLLGHLTGPLGTGILASFRRIVLEIAEKRIQPQLIPGIEAMLPDSPLTSFLAKAQRQSNVQMSVIAGDIEGGHLLKQLTVIFTDWMFFEDKRNDLVVDTHSMFAGLAISNPTYAVFDRGSNVNHFSYFKNSQTRFALIDWLTAEQPTKVNGFYALNAAHGQTAQEDSTNMQPLRGRITANDAWRNDDKPIVILLPGIMGSHLEDRETDEPVSSGNRIWLQITEIMTGGLSNMRMHGDRPILPECLIDHYYGDLFRHLQKTCHVIPFAYDWRKSIQDSATLLIKQLTEVLKGSKQPVHILAHSMGGLVVRTAFADKQKNTLWDQIVKRGGNFTMLGTPNHGSHLMVENLFCKGSTLRKLARVDLIHSPQDILNIMADFVGALELLPSPLFQDEDRHGFDYFDSQQWAAHKHKNRDRWFDNGLLGQPSADNLKKAKTLWEDYLNQGLSHADRINYVFGRAKSTPSGLTEQHGELAFCGTGKGDGSVSWKSGRLDWLDESCYWYMPVEHSEMMAKSKYFEAISELVLQNTTQRLSQQQPDIEKPIKRSGDSVTLRTVSPPTLVNEYNLLTLSDLPPLPPLNINQRLYVCVKAMDLRYVQHPLMCGHYAGDAIVGTEGLVDRYLVNGALTQRERMGIFADEVGTSSIIISPVNAEERQRGTNRGAIVVGLGEWGRLSNQKLIESVRDSVLAYLLHIQESQHQHSSQADGAANSLELNSLLLGYSANSHIIIESSVDSIVRGVCAANHKFRTTCNNLSHEEVLHIGRLNFVEYYLETAITAAHAVATLPKRLDNDLKTMHIQLEVDKELHFRGDTQTRLSVNASSSYWPQMSITNADKQHTYTEQAAQPPLKLPPKVLALLQQTADEKLGDHHATSREAAERLAYLFVSQRARAEATVQQRQPGLIEALISKIIHSSDYDMDICRTLFELMVPLDFKAAARQTERLMLVLDAYTANLPWEMLQADDEPLALKVAMVRKLASSRYRRVVNNAGQNTACIIGNPSTDGFYDHFPRHEDDTSTTNSLVSLKGAAKEAQTVHRLLERMHYSVQHLYPSPDNQPHHRALSVLKTLFKEPYRILVIAAHGEVNIKGKDGRERTGVILSDGIMLTAAEIGQLEVVPELVFLNCCHLGKTTPKQASYNRLAYSIARELIEMGVRCVIAAGWAVNDEAACTFAEHFFEQFVAENQPFGTAVWKARKVCYQKHSRFNTWGAYQAYGDPSYTLEATKNLQTPHPLTRFVAPQELTDALESLRLDYLHRHAISLSSLNKDIDRYLEQVPQHWLKRSDVQAALGDLYRAIGKQGLESAIEAYQKALIYDDANSLIPLEIIDHLAKVEIRLAKEQTDLKRLKKAQNRLQQLIDITSDTHDSNHINASRQLLMAHTLRDEAEITLMGLPATLSNQQKWKSIETLLHRSRRCYADIENQAQTLNIEACVNRLLLEALFKQTTPSSADDTHLLEHNDSLAKRCKAEARKRFAVSYDFFDAIRVADASLSICLNNDALSDENCKQALVKIYLDASSDLIPTPAQIETVLQQLRQLARFINIRPRYPLTENNQAEAANHEARIDDKDANRAKTIEQAANELAIQLKRG